MALGAAAGRRRIAVPALVPAAEVGLTWATSAQDHELVAASYGGRGGDLLVETPHGRLPPGFEEAVFRLAVRGFPILLAHPERNASLCRTPERLAALVRSGVLLQVEARSLVDEADRGLRRLVLELIREELAHVIASDAHSPGPWRSPSLSVAVRAGDGPTGSLDGR